MHPRRHKGKPIEFSKLVLGMVMGTYFFGVLFGSYIIYRASTDLGTLLAAWLSFIGAPTATAIGWYYWKAKNENMQKNAPSQIETPGIQSGIEEETPI